MPKYETIIHEWFEEVWNQRKTETIGRLLAADAMVHGIADENGKELRGVKAFEHFHALFLKGFPNVKVEVLDLLADGDKLACRCVVRARHEGEWMGISATNKDVEFTGICIAYVKNGKMIEGWNSFDFLSLYSQLGVLSKPV
jgi:predicted ester cyclase